MALGARRRGSRVAVVWSTPPDAPRHATDGFTSDDDALLVVLTRPATEAATPTIGQLEELTDLVNGHATPIDLLVVADQRLLETLEQHSRSHTTGAWALIGELGRSSRATVVLSGTTGRSRSGIRSFTRQGWTVRAVGDGVVAPRNVAELLEAVA
jgi:hypothetical protein